MPLSIYPASRAAVRACARCHASSRPRQALFSTAARSLPETPQGVARQHVQTPRTLSRPRWFSQTALRRENQDAASGESPARAGATPPNYYELFPDSLPAGPPPAGAFAVDVRALRREFLALQGRAHPDLHRPEDKTRAQSASARLNEAFRTLADPLLRAQYLLSLRGVDVAGDEEGKVADMELLGDVMEAREEIEEAESEGELEGPRGVNDGRIAESVEELGRAFGADDMEGARREAVRLRYWVNIKQCLDEWEPGKPIELHH